MRTTPYVPLSCFACSLYYIIGIEDKFPECSPQHLATPETHDFTTTYPFALVVRAG